MGQNELQGGEGVNLILTKRFRIQGAAAPYMASELFPNITLENDRPEWAFLAGDRLCSGDGTDGAVAAQTSNVFVLNPAGSNALVVVSRIITISFATQSLDIRIGINNSALSGARKPFRDMRFGQPAGTAGSIAQVGIHTSATVIGRIILALRVLDDERIMLPGAWILTPGSFLAVSSGDVNNRVDANFEWMERAAQPGELQGAVQGP